MKIIGLTGGIGSGKTTVAKIFASLGVGVYIADQEAKRLMQEDRILRGQIIALLGETAYLDGKLNRSWISAKVFGDKELLEKLNRLVHPAVANDFQNWMHHQDGKYVIKEAAILFENDGYKKCDFTILVTAPKAERIKRVMKRDKKTEKQVIDRMRHQWEDEKKIPLANFLISNTNLLQLREAVCKIHQEITVLA